MVRRIPVRPAGLIPALLLGALVVPALLGNYWLFVSTLAIVYVLLALSLVVLVGWSGQLNIHVAALGLGWGAYAAFALTVYGVPVVWALLGAGLVAAPFAFVIGLIAVRFRGLELAVATLAMGLIFERLAFRNLAKALARQASSFATPFESSFVPMKRPSLFGFHTQTDVAYFYFSMAVAILLFFVVTNLGRGSIGRTLRALREREVMAETLGVPVLRYRIGAFVMSIGIAAAAGALFASMQQGIAPDSFDLDLSFRILAATVIGGIRSPSGAVIGGSVAALLPEVVRFGPLQIFGGERLFLVFGVGMVLVLWKLPQGLVGLARGRDTDEVLGDVGLAMIEEPASGNGEPPRVEVARRLYATPVERHLRRTLLRVENVRIRFGGVVALDGAGLTVPEGEICALIGPNGAGKSTMFNCVSGLLSPESGEIYLEGRDITQLPANRRAALGIGRTFQTVEVFREMSVVENLMVAGYLTRMSGPLGEAFSLPSARRSERVLKLRALEILSILGLRSLADRKPADLPLGLLRVLEVGMALVARPRLLLLDEPSAGLDARETEMLGDLISKVRATYELGVLLVEHDMAMVGRLAEHVYVLDFGAIIAQGTPQEVRQNPLVLEKYLGSDTPAPEHELETVAAPRRSTSGRRRAAR